MIAEAQIVKTFQENIETYKRKLENPLLTQPEKLKLEKEIADAEYEIGKILQG